MKIAIFGTGSVGQTFAEKFTSLGHDVMVGTRHVADTLARTTPDGMGTPPFSTWHSTHPEVQLGTFGQAAAFGEIVLNALNGGGVVPAFSSCQPADLDGKIIIDVSNPLDFSKGFPPSLLEGLNNTNSLGEALQKTIPQAKVVKTLNTMWAGLMVNPGMINGGNHTNFISGNDAAAKGTVRNILAEFGWKAENILDLGDITNARGTEAMLPIWVRVYAATQTGAFNFAVLR